MIPLQLFKHTSRIKKLRSTGTTEYSNGKINHGNSDADLVLLSNRDLMDPKKRKTIIIILNFWKMKTLIILLRGVYCE